ncbi:YqhG family protein [Halobacillus sp. Marseille-Q1614]|uniref:YqhG family protein n=1 Tax=Halobacillus sp. Marseille-Q1614 TaxID=2709134 RepID=UPI001570D1B2|nr:YqhG family protein [Halobacillus sp. Marseille-Q1614]
MTSNPHYEFTKEFFSINGCTLEERNGKFLKVQLTQEMDEALMNRPFYWHYIKKMNRAGDPMSLSFKDISLGDEEDGVFLHAGTPKLHQIYDFALSKGKFTRLYESIAHQSTHLPLQPWMFVNLQLTFRGKQTRNEILSLGLNLINGMVLSNAMEKIKDLPLTPKVSDFTFPMTPLIRLESGYNRLIQYAEDYITQMSSTWAVESEEQLNTEKGLLDDFYTRDDMEEETYMKEAEQLEVRYKPRITLTTANGGLFYLSLYTGQKVAQ